MKIFTGKVMAKKSEKTATIAVERIFVNPFYGKRTRRTKKYHVHDTLGVTVGQVVNFVACKPYSKTKKWKITGIVGQPKSKKVKTNTKKEKKGTKK